MKRLLIYLGLLGVSFSFISQACQSECKSFCGKDTTINKMAEILYNFGYALENVEIPVFEKLGNILPYGVIAFCCKNYPRQTIFLCALGLFNCLYRNRFVRNTLTRYGVIDKQSCKKTIKTALPVEQLEDSFFIFEDNDLVGVPIEKYNEKELFSSSSNVISVTKKSFKESVSFL